MTAQLDARTFATLASEASVLAERSRAMGEQARRARAAVEEVTRALQTIDPRGIAQQLRRMADIVRNPPSPLDRVAAE